MSDATSTPVDKANEGPIRAEITKVDEQAKMLRLALEHLTNEVAKSTHESKLAKIETIKLAESVSDIPGLVRRLHELEADRIIGTINADRVKDRKALVELIAQERIARDAAIMESERRSDAKIQAVDARVDELSLKVGVHAEEVTGVTQVLVKRVDEHASFFEKNKQPIAASFGSTGVALGVFHAAPVVWWWFKAYAVTKGWLAP